MPFGATPPITARPMRDGPRPRWPGRWALRLAGPRVYGDVRVEDRWMGDGRAEATAGDIDRALALYRTACGLLIGSAAGLTLLAWLIAR